MKRLRHKYAAYGASLLALNAAVFGMTDAAQVPSFMLIVGFLLLWLNIWALCYVALKFMGYYGVKVRRQGRFALYLSGLVSGVVALQSIGELSGRDVLVLLPLVILGYIYSAYAKVDRRNFES